MQVLYGSPRSFITACFHGYDWCGYRKLRTNRPYYGNITLGPDSAGSRVGVCNPHGGLDTVTVSDCHVVLGLINPER